ncbi:DUF1846 domain-containing protein [Elusimicrobiota bacterium]
MVQTIGFSEEKYLELQSRAILERMEKFNNKLYLEFGGKLIYDLHAARVLPGFDPNVKIKLLQKLKDNASIILCIYAGDIERKKVRADFGITYDSDALKLIDDLKDWGIDIHAVVITRFEHQPAAVVFKNKLERRGISVFKHYPIAGYPANVDKIISEEGYGKNEYIPTDKPLVVITAPGPNSGKLSTCLSQMYHENRRGIQAGYAKFETFPIWNVPLKHPVNIAYEAATVDIRDFNEIDHFHLEAYGKKSVNYNRDLEIFPVLKNILEKITGKESVYKSPTDMGVNMAGFAITNDNAVKEASKNEVIRRYFKIKCEYALGLADEESVNRAEIILKGLNLKPENRSVVTPARKTAVEGQESGKGNEGIFCGGALELQNGEIITGKNSPLMHVASSVILNAIKHLSKVPDEIHLLAPNITESITDLKKSILISKSASLDLEETLIALSIGAASNTTSQLAMENLKKLRGCEMHMTHIPTPGDEAGLRRLGINLTSDPNFPSRDLLMY